MKYDYVMIYDTPLHKFVDMYLLSFISYFLILFSVLNDS